MEHTMSLQLTLSDVPESVRQTVLWFLDVRPDDGGPLPSPDVPAILGAMGCGLLHGSALNWVLGRAEVRQEGGTVRVRSLRRGHRVIEVARRVVGYSGGERAACSREGRVLVTHVGLVAAERWLETERPAPARHAAAGEAILEALGDGTLTGQAIATRAGYSFDYIRQILPGMVGRGLLRKVRGGYRRM
jgi:hypothetical protein